MPAVYGAIGDKWHQLGGPNSFLGEPVEDETDFSENGRISVFHGGSIVWWPDVGAFAIGEMFIHYTGLNCFHDTSGPGSDEPYAVLGVSVPSIPDRSFRTVIHGDVDGGDTRPEVIELYRGPPKGIAISYALMEHDSGNPEQYRDAMRGVASAATGAAAEAVKFIPKIGPILAPATGPLLALLNPTIADALESLLGLGDDLIGKGSIVLSAKEMVLMASRPNQVEKNVGFKIPSPLLLGDGGSYKIYFGGVIAP
jgi:hypothetical protein